MVDDKELEIKRQFLDEAQEYIETLASSFIDLAQGFSGEVVNEALRAAHSIKGGAGLMGFKPLSGLAHRLEDGLKVLKTNRHRVVVDARLEQLLLQAIDCMGQVTEQNRQQLAAHKQNGFAPYDSSATTGGDWWQHEVEPVFQELKAILGEPDEEDPRSLLPPEDNQNIAALLFESEVEGCLQRLESVLDEHAPCLREEVIILAQELGGLGEMLQLTAYVQLCQSIEDQIELASEPNLVTAAQSALRVWRQAQKLVLSGDLESMPDQVMLTEDSLQEILTAEEPPEEREERLEESPANPLSAHLVEGLRAFSSMGVAGSEADDEPLLDPLVEHWQQDLPEEVASNGAAKVAIPTDVVTDAVDPEPTIAPPMNGARSHGGADGGSDHANRADAPTPDAQAPYASQESAQPATAPDPNSTVRVPVKHINQLSDLFGELTIERNCLELELKRLRQMVTTMQGRIHTLDRVNTDLRDAYDHVATQTNSSLPPPDAIAEDDSSQHFDVLEMDRYKAPHLPFRELIETIVQLQEVGEDIDLSLDHTEQTTRGLRKTSRHLQKSITQLRMRPLADIFDRFPRALRQMSLEYDKPVELKIQGDRTLVDRNVLESLQEPLLHIIRNCFDHGIEAKETRQQLQKPATGTIAISARQRNSRTMITIRDDGGGIALDRIRDRAGQMGLDKALLAAASKQDLLSLIFEPGFTTANQVTNLSGRGVGMDVVRNKLKEIRGDIQVDTQAGEGTVFTLSIPFTLSVTRVLIVESRGMRMAFPVDAIEEMVALSPEQILSTAGKASFAWNGELLQLVTLSSWLNFNCPVYLDSPEIAPAIASPTVLIVQYNNRLVGIQVERSWGEQEAAIRKVVGELAMPDGFNSCTILGDGRVVPLVSVPELLYWIASCEATGAAAGTEANLAHSLAEGSHSLAGMRLPSKPTILLIDDSVNVRRFMALTLEKAGYQVAEAKDGQDALDKLAAGLSVEAVICDIEMPRLDGYGFLSKLKAKDSYEHLPVAMLTSRSGQKHRRMAMNLGASAYFTKPYNEQTLLQKLEELIQLTPVS